MSDRLPILPPVEPSRAGEAAPATTVMCCLSKGLAAPVGSLIAGDAMLMVGARAERRHVGGDLRYLRVHHAELQLGQPPELRQ
jgi:hypothetical protein